MLGFVRRYKLIRNHDRYPHLNKSAIDEKLRCDKEAAATVKARTIDRSRPVSGVMQSDVQSVVDIPGC